MIACYLITSNTSMHPCHMQSTVQLCFYILPLVLHLSGLRKGSFIGIAFFSRHSFWDNALCFQIFNARDMAQKTVIGQDQIVYSTDKDFLEQEFEANEWDKKFRELERSDWEGLTVIWVKQFNRYIYELCISVLHGWQLDDHSRILLLQW